MKKIFALLLLSVLAFAYRVEIKKWEKQDGTFLKFLKTRSFPTKLYYNADTKIRRILDHIPLGTKIYILMNNNDLKKMSFNFKDNILLITKEKKGFKYTLFKSQVSKTIKKAEVAITHSLGYDISNKLGSYSLSGKIADIFSDKVDFKHLPKNTIVKIIYEQKSKFGDVVGTKVLFAEIKNRQYDFQAYYNPKDGLYYDQNGKSLKGMFIPRPIDHFIKITSGFGMRYHPILHIKRMHDGIDYAARIGTPVKSVANGVVIFAGRMSGYGKVIKIKHPNGYITLYGHLSRIRVVNKQHVSQGQIIGNVGNTGLSTGPHLHFGVMLNGKWINPKRIRRSSKIVLTGKAKKEFLSYVKELQSKYNIKVASSK